jgi:hypothetical protein
MPNHCAARVVTLLNASDDTVEMIGGMLEPYIRGPVSCHVADIRKGVIDFTAFLEEYDPDVVVFDISPPYHENGCYRTVRDNASMATRDVVLTTTNLARLNEVLGVDCDATEIVGLPGDMGLISHHHECISFRTDRTRARRRSWFAAGRSEGESTEASNERFARDCSRYLVGERFWGGPTDTMHA